MDLRYLGHSCFELVSKRGTRALIDPFLRGSRSAPISPDELEPVDLVLVTHGGFDHLGDAFEIMGKHAAMLFGSADVAIAAQLAGIHRSRIFPMASGANRSHAGFNVQSVEAHHVSITKTAEGYISGQPLSFVIRADDESDGPVVYHSGDTSLFSDMKLIAELYRPQVALLGVGGPAHLPHELTPREAAIAIEWLGVARAIPMHWVPGDTFAADFKTEVEARTPQVRAEIMQSGDTVAL